MNQPFVIGRDIKDISYAFASFVITILRLTMVLCAGIAIFTTYPFFKEIMVSCIFLVIILDFYDGILFNKSLMAREKYWRIKRRLFDSFADRAVIQMICIPLLIVDSTFIWFYLAILTREILISGYCTLSYRKNIIIYPKRLAKLAAIMVGVTIIVYLTTSFILSSCVVVIMFLVSLAALNEYKNTLKHSGYNTQNSSRSDMIEVY